MKYISIKGLNKPVSALMKGTDYFYHDSYEKAAANMDAYLAIGGNSVDTAHIYCGGQSEEVIGRYMQERGNRDQIVILTKGAHHDQNGPRVNKKTSRATSQRVLNDCRRISSICTLFTVTTRRFRQEKLLRL